MTTPRTIRARVTTARINLTHLEARIAAALDALTAEERDHDGYPTSASGADRGPGGGGLVIAVDGDRVPVTSVEHAVLTRHRGTFPLDELDDLVRTAAHALDLAVNFCLRHTPGVTAADLSRLRCAGDDTPTGASCTQLADPRRTDGLCIDCGRRVDSDARRRRKRRTA